MEFITNIRQILIDSFNELILTVRDYLPNLVIALTLLLVGLILARLVKWMIIRLSAGLDRMVNVVGFTSIPVLRNWPIGVILGWLAFWLLILFFVTAAVESLGLPGLANWLGNLINNLPVYFIAMISVFVGIWVGNYVHNWIMVSANKSARHQAEVLGRTLRAIIIGFAVISALSQIGLDVSLFDPQAAVIVRIVAFHSADDSTCRPRPCLLGRPVGNGRIDRGHRRAGICAGNCLPKPRDLPVMGTIQGG